MSECAEKFLITEEEMKNYPSIREKILKFETVSDLAEKLAGILANMQIRLSDLVEEADLKENLTKIFPEMNASSVEPHPVFEHLCQGIFSGNSCSGEADLSAESVPAVDDDLRREIKCCAETLNRHSHTVIHGNLTAAAVCDADGKIQIQRCVPPYCGPMGYDIGTFITSLLFAWCYGDAMIQNPAEKDDFCDWCLDTAADLVDQFVVNYDETYDICANAPAAKEPGFKADYLSSVTEHIAAAAGIETILQLEHRGKAAELAGIEEEEKRTLAEQIALLFARDCIMNRENYFCGADFAAAIERSADQAKENF